MTDMVRERTKIIDELAICDLSETDIAVMDTSSQPLRELMQLLVVLYTDTWMVALRMLTDLH